MSSMLAAYRNILAYAGLKTRSDGHILLPDNTCILFDDHQPFVLPVDEQFKNPDQKRVYFHPFCESIVKGESDIVAHLRFRIGLRLNYVLGTLITLLIRIATSPECVVKLNDEQTALIRVFKDIEPVKNPADTKNNLLQTWLGTFLEQTRKNPATWGVRFFLRKPGTYQGSTYSRVGVTAFPYYETLTEQKNLKPVHRKTLHALFQMIFPNIDVPEAYNFGTRSTDIPFLEALLYTTAKVATDLNAAIEMFSGILTDEDLKLEPIRMDWADDLENWDQFRSEIKKIPSLWGNTGATRVAERTQMVHDASVPEPPREEPPRAAPPEPVAPPKPALVNPPPRESPAPPAEKRKLSIADVIPSTPYPQYAPASYVDPRYSAPVPQAYVDPRYSAPVPQAYVDPRYPAASYAVPYEPLIQGQNGQMYRTVTTASGQPVLVPVAPAQPSVPPGWPPPLPPATPTGFVPFR